MRCVRAWPAVREGPFELLLPGRPCAQVLEDTAASLEAYHECVSLAPWRGEARRKAATDALAPCVSPRRQLLSPAPAACGSERRDAGTGAPRPRHASRRLSLPPSPRVACALPLSGPGQHGGSGGTTRGRLPLPLRELGAGADLCATSRAGQRRGRGCEGGGGGGHSLHASGGAAAGRTHARRTVPPRRGACVSVASGGVWRLWVGLSFKRGAHA